MSQNEYLRIIINKSETRILKQYAKIIISNTLRRNTMITHIDRKYREFTSLIQQILPYYPKMVPEKYHDPIIKSQGALSQILSVIITAILSSKFCERSQIPKIVRK